MLNNKIYNVAHLRAQSVHQRIYLVGHEGHERSLQVRERVGAQRLLSGEHLLDTVALLGLGYTYRNVMIWRDWDEIGLKK